MTRTLCILMFVFTGIVNCVEAQIYNEDDKEGLRIFLRQPSAEAGKINAQQLRLQISDTLNWQTNEAWVINIPGLIWNNDHPKRLIQIIEFLAPQVNTLPLITDVENAGAKFRVSAEIYLEGTTNAIGQGAGISAEVGYGIHGTSPITWTNWDTANYVGDTYNGKDVYRGVLTAPAAGTYDIAARFTHNGNQFFADSEGSAVYDPAKAVVLKTFAGQDASISWGNVQWPTACFSSPGATMWDDGTYKGSEIYGRVYYAGITENPTPNNDLKAQLGIGQGNPLTDDWSWADASWINQVSINHEYRAPFTAPGIPGNYRYVYRYRVDAGWTYCGAGAGTVDANFDPNTSGILHVTNY